MATPLDPGAIRALTIDLVRQPSVSPDIAGETACALGIEAKLPAEIEHGLWPTPDGRPIVWGFVPGATAKTVVLLAHYDVVGVGEYAALGPDGTDLAFDPPALRERLLERFRTHDGALGADGLADLAAEAREPGTWLFGRGALDMKSGVAIGVELLRAVGQTRSLACGVLLVVTPDEENESAGMIAAVDELVRFRAAHVLELVGLLNLDSGGDRAAYVGAMGKLEVGCYVLGVPTHAGLPFEGLDAAELAAEITTRVARSRDLVDEVEGMKGPPAVTLRLRDLKAEYNIQTALEAVIEFNVITAARPVDRTLDLVRAEAIRALQTLLSEHLSMAAWLDPQRADRALNAEPTSCVLTYDELRRRAEVDEDRDPLSIAGGPAPPDRDARAATLERIRALIRAAKLTGPLVIVHLLPPYYPHATPGRGLLIQAVHAALAGEAAISVRSYYPYVSDMCYAAWRAEPIEHVARQMPAFGREYHLPARSAAALDLDIVNFGPWGRDAHGLLERVHVSYTFGRLPQLLWKILNELSALSAAAEAITHEERP